MNIAKKDFHTAELMHIPLFGDSKSKLLNLLANELQFGKKDDLISIFTPNAEQCVQANQDVRFFRWLMAATVRIPDGSSLVLASRLLSLKGDRLPIHERITGIDLAVDLIELAKTYRKRVFLLGGRKNVATKTAKKYELLPPKTVKKTRGYEIIGTQGFADIRDYSESENKIVLKQVADFQADILLVGYGAPWQEKWVIENKVALQKMGVSIVLVVGGAFDVLSGDIQRAPVWMRRVALEWLWRLYQEPWRWRRQLRLFEFWGKVLFQALT